LLAVDEAVLARFTDLRFLSPFARQTPLGGLLATGSIISWSVGRVDPSPAIRAPATL
jgi:hypothetical protein